jgi:hypothetical protein
VPIEDDMAVQHRLRLPTKIDIIGLQPEEIAVLQHITRRRLSQLRLPVAIKPAGKSIAHKSIAMKISQRKKSLREIRETVMANGTPP